MSYINNKSLKPFHYYIIISLTLCSSTCKKDEACGDGSHEYIYKTNQSSVAVNLVVGDAANDSIWSIQDINYPDASFGQLDANVSVQQGVGPQQCWENYYYVKSGQFYFFFNHDTVQAIGWPAINHTNRGLLKRVKVDLNYLQTNNFAITYP